MQAKRYTSEEILEKAENLSYIPTVVANLMEMISNPDTTVHEITGMIKKDQGLVARVFKVANSAFYGRLKKAETLTDAIVTLGLRGLKSLVIAQAVKHILTTAGADNHTLWEHAVKVSTASAVLARELRYDVLDDALIGGLVHDIGKAFIGSVYPEVPLLINQRVEKDHVAYKDAERIILGFDHSEIGALITEKWNFPPRIIDVIRYHHCTDGINEVSMESQKVIRIIQLADTISNGYDTSPDFLPDILLEKMGPAGAFDLTADHVSHLMEEIKIKWQTKEENVLFC